jgi:2-dehydro-3-deoxyphosphogluconate aldolase / (4S)-4-hydroxy-2-oxoglutarate aldolase
MKTDDFLDVLWQERSTAVLRTNDPVAAKKAMEAAVLGGFRIIEFTLTIPGAMDLIKDFSWHSDLIVGAGSVLSIENAREAVSRGAKFLVSPVADPEVIAVARELEVPVIAGTFTPTEMLNAYRWGAPLQKLFPEPPGGPKYVKACLGPMPFLRLVPSHSGVDATNVLAYLEAGAYAVAFVTTLFDPQDILQQKFDRIEERARSLRQLTHSFQR